MAIEFGTPARYLPAPRDNATGDLIRNARRAPDAPAFARWLGGMWRTLTWAEFADRFATRLRQAATRAAYLRADGRVPYEQVLRVLGAMNRAGSVEVGLVADPDVGP